ncbi:alpha/beta-hydrolase family protein [Streptomyces sp. INA 01156]
MDLLPRGPIEGTGGGSRPVRRRLRRLAAAAAEPAPPPVRRRGEPGIVRQRGRLQRRSRPAHPYRRHLFAGPPNFNTLFRQFSDQRDPGSPEIQPVYRDGRTVRFTTNPATGIPQRTGLGTAPGPLPDAPLRPDRLVEPPSPLQ